MSVLSVLQIQGTIHALRTQKTEDDVLEWDTESRQFQNECIIPRKLEGGYGGIIHEF